MNPLRKLASQTVIYGLSSIIGRFLNYLLVPLYTHVFSPAEYGVVSEFYAYSGFFAVLLVFGFETGFFRFSKAEEDKEQVYSTALGFVAVANLVFIVLMVVFVTPIAEGLQYANHREYFYWFALILALDSVAAIPFARLRAENKAVLFAGIKLFEIAATVGLNLFFIMYSKKAFEAGSNSWAASLYNPQIGVGYIFISNLAASALKFLFLIPFMTGLVNGINRGLFLKMLRYSLPMVVIGFAGIVNEMLDRMLLKYLLPGSTESNLHQLGIYGACYKLSVLMTLFIQAFRYAAEPFFFAQAGKENSPAIYATVMKYFVVVCTGVFLLVMLYLDWIQFFIGKDFREGLHVVPVLLLANMFLGIYVNLSIWYKLTDNTLMGAAVSIGGAIITLVLNLLFVAKYGYTASAWATLVCYASMAGVSYLLGQKYYPVPYPVGRILFYIVSGIAIWQLYAVITTYTAMAHIIPATVLMASFGIMALVLDGRPVLQRIGLSKTN